MSEAPAGIDTEVLNAPTTIREAVTLASKNRVDVETTKEQLANYFEEYANYLGFNGQEARNFFEGKVDFTFHVQEAQAKYGHPNMSPIEIALNKALIKFGRVKPLGQVTTQQDGRLTLCINLHDIAKYLPKAKRNQAPAETFQAQVHTVINHELRHLLQHITQSEVMARQTKQNLANQKLVMGLGTALFVGGIVPETLPYTFGALAGLKCITLLEYGKGINAEKSPSEAQKIDMSQLQRRPFNFTDRTQQIPSTSI